MSFRPRNLVVAALLLASVAFVACGGGDKKKKDEPQAGSVSGLPAATATLDNAASSTPEASASPSGLSAPKIGATLDRLVVPTIKIDAPVESKGINSRGEMEDPTGKDAAAWYNFSEFPGFGGNAVFSGHVDWYTGELGVFGRMRDLKNGDEIFLKLSDGMELKYQVVSTIVYESAKAPVEEIVARTPKDSITFITCEGVFDRRSGDYSHRRIVRAERVA
jgi:LPXTG-site transpeptidase (sortase) family protein